MEPAGLSIGPWGGQDGARWDDGIYSTVRQLVIVHGSGIDSIQIEYDQKGYSIWCDKHGGNGGSKTDKVELDYPNEFLTSIHGTYGKLNEWGSFLVRSLTFQTNRKTYGPFGVEKGTCFSFRGNIVGFHGRSGWYLDAIGVYFKPIQEQKTSTKSLVHTQTYTTNESSKNGYSVLQGNLNQSFDIVLSVRQTDDKGKAPPSKILSRESCSSQESSDSESKPKKSGGTKKMISFDEGALVYGPWGGTGGTRFDDGIFTGITQIKLSRNVGIVSIRVCYDRDGQSIWGSKHGGTGGFKHERIIFDYPTEILTHISGTYGALMYMGPNVVKSLTFYTNKGKHGPFGEEQGPSFTNKIDEGKIVGFHGREGFFLDAIGVRVIEAKISPAKPSRYNAIVPPHEGHVAQIENSPWSNKLVLARRGPYEEVVYGVVKEPVGCGPGPWGGDGGRAWDDGVFSGIRQIFVTKEEAICSIQIEYDRNGQSVWSVKHGGNGGITTHRVKLDYPHEVVVCVYGYYGEMKNDEKHKVIKSISFETSRGKYGPFGEEIGTFFTSTTTQGKVLGFHGRSSLYLDAIGVHMQHWLGNQRTSKSSLFKFF